MVNDIDCDMYADLHMGNPHKEQVTSLYNVSPQDLHILSMSLPTLFLNLKYVTG